MVVLRCFLESLAILYEKLRKVIEINRCQKALKSYRNYKRLLKTLEKFGKSMKL